MARFVPKVVGGLVLAMASAGAAGGCADNETMLFVVGVQAVEGDCLAKPDLSKPFRGAGVLDLALRNPPVYSAALIVGNQLVQRGDEEKLRTESSHISLEGAEVTVTDLAGTQLDAYTVDVSGYVPATKGNEAGYGVATVPLIPGGGDITAGATYRAIVRVFGRTLGGQVVESGEFVYPISVCFGCLVTFPVDAWDQTLSTSYECNSTQPPEDSDACIIGQDTTIDCRLCRGNSVCD
ncbi:MAG: hypothetical protein IT376_23155 [Polyangiaceae bacterium]|nr:hypothetical protein [Polyangiaceae bacterium]